MRPKRSKPGFVYIMTDGELYKIGITQEVDNMNENTGGIGILSALGLIFITMKLTGVVSWSWWWVLAPFWIPTALGLAIMAIVVIFAVMSKGGESR